MALAALASIPALDACAAGQAGIRRLDAAQFQFSADAALERTAQNHGVETRGFANTSEAAAPVAGDSVCALVSLFEGEEIRQWIVALRMDNVAPDGMRTPPRLTLFSASGNEIGFDSTMAVVDVFTLGPVASQSDNLPGRNRGIRESSAKATVNREFLALGFDRACVTVERLKIAREEGRIGRDEQFGLSGSPPTPQEAEKGRDLISRAGLTLEDERAFAGTFPALLAFVDLVNKTRGLREILATVVERPSIWSVIRRFGRIDWGVRFESASVAPVDPEVAGMPEWMSLYQLPFTLLLNEKPALQCILLVTQPHPPLLTSAGIVGVMAKPPTEDGRSLVIRLLASKRGGGAAG